MINQKINRRPFATSLCEAFHREFSEVIKKYSFDDTVMLYEHLFSLLDKINLYYNKNAPNLTPTYWKKAVKEETELAKKYGRKLTSYFEWDKWEYFSFCLIIYQKDLLTRDDWNNLANAEEQSFSASERDQFFWFVNNVLKHDFNKLLLYGKPEKEIDTIGNSSNENLLDKTYQRTKEKINDLIDSMEKIKPVFKDSSDRAVFIQLLIDYFYGREITLPKTKIETYINTDTLLANTLRDIHKECGKNERLSSDTKYTELLTMLKNFSKINHKKMVEKMQK